MRGERRKLDSLALLPASAHGDAEPCRAALVEGGAALLEHIIAQDLGALWHQSLWADGCWEGLPLRVREELHAARRSAAANYLAQRDALKHIDQLFETQGISYVVIKGAHIREYVYPDPALRPASDIDILIAPADRRRVARTLLDAGYRVSVGPKNISHEATFTRGSVDIDLHWNILRPGRTRIDMTASLIERRQRGDYGWVLADRDTLFLLLVHPAFAKYVCSPHMGLLRVADFFLWIRRREIDWPPVLALLDAAGLKTAAWFMLSGFRMLAQPPQAPIVDDWIETVRPRGLREAYLRQWLLRDLPSRWLHRRLLVQAGLTLPLHDHLGDAIHALRGWYRSRKHRLRDARLLLGHDYSL